MKTQQACDGFYPVAAAASYYDDLEDKLWCHTSSINQSTKHFENLSLYAFKLCTFLKMA
jgi:hypothetical protein